MTIQAAWRITWNESEKGWGQTYLYTELFSSKDEMDAAIKDHWDEYPDPEVAGVPDYYVYPDVFNAKLVEITPDQAKQLEENGGRLKI